MSTYSETVVFLTTIGKATLDKADEKWKWLVRPCWEIWGNIIASHDAEDYFLGFEDAQIFCNYLNDKERTTTRFYRVEPVEAK